LVVCAGEDVLTHEPYVSAQRTPYGRGGKCTAVAAGSQIRCAGAGAIVGFRRTEEAAMVAVWIVGTVIPIVCALVLAHFAQSIEHDMDYDGGRPSRPTPEQVNAQRFTVGIVAASIAGRS
jgi:hypothetical protein